MPAAAVSGRAVAGGSAVGFAAGWNIADTGAVAEELASAYGVGLAVVGLFTTALFLAHMVMQLPSGRLSDRLGPARVCAAGLLVLLACNALATVAPETWLVLVARTLMGAGTALAFIGGSDYVRAAGGSPFAQGLYGGLATAGGGAALGVVPALDGALGWRAPFVSAIAVAAGAGLLLAVSPHPATPGRTGARVRTPVRALARDPGLVRLAVVFAASFGLSVVIGNWAVTLLERRTGLSAGAAGAVAALTLVLGVVSRPLGGWLLHRHAEHARAGIAVAALTGGAGTLALASGSAVVAVAGACIVGLAAGIAFAPAFSGAARLHPQAPATAIGLVNATGAFTILAATPLVGAAFAAGAEVWAFAALAALWAASALVSTTARRSRRG